MIIKSIAGYNFKGFSSISVSFKENVTYIVGPNGAGKSGIGVDLIWFVMQGIAEKSSGGNVPLVGERYRFIGKASAASICEVNLYDEVKKIEIKVIRKMLKSGTELSFSTNALNLKLDQKWLNDLFNVFFIAPKRFLDLSSKDQALTLGIQTKKWDDQIRDLKADVTIYNKDIEKIENLPVVAKVDKVELKPLQDEMEQLQKNIVTQHQENQRINKATKAAWEAEKKQIDDDVRTFNKEQSENRVIYNQCEDAFAVIIKHGFPAEETWKFRNELNEKIKTDRIAADYYPAEPTDLQFQPDDYVPGPDEKVYIKELPDQKAISELQQKILTATETNTQAKAYDDYLKKLEEKEELQKKLSANKKQQLVLAEEKLEYVKAFKLPFSKLSIGDEGELLFNGRPLKTPHFSTGELIRMIPTLLSSLNPELKYVFLQDFSLLDEANQEKTINELVSLGFQLVVEYVGTEAVENRNCILLKNNHVVDSIEPTTNGTIKTTTPIS